tara:strand:- start:6711 stop:7001 length:291 start_codon:yes stop_codon:yes gene_type:complete
MLNFRNILGCRLFNLIDIIIKTMSKKLLFFLFTLLFFHTNAHAYLDPGSGSFLLQILAFISATILSFWLFLKNTFKNLLNKIFKFIKIFKKDKKVD